MTEDETIPIFRATTDPTDIFIPREIDDDEATVTTGENANNNGPKITEICLRWEFPTNMDKKTLVKSHLDILKAMKAASPSLVIIDNNREEHNSTKTLNMSNKGAKFEFWTSKNRAPVNQRAICQHRIRTDTPLSTIKTAWEVMEKLKKAKAYVGTHELGEKVKEVAHLGFLLKTHVTHVSRNIAIQRLRQRLKQEFEEVPKFTLVVQNIATGKGQDLSNRAKAYDIRCDQKDAPRLSKMLQSQTFANDPVYMPYYMKKKNPRTFLNALRVQNEIHRNAYVIKAQGLNTTMMNSFWNRIASEPGMMEVVPTHNFIQNGEWRILVHKDQFQQLHSRLTDHLAQWWDSVDEIEKRESPYEDPQIVSKRSSGQEESDEESLNTYSTMLTNMYDPPSDEECDSKEPTERPIFTQPQETTTYAQRTHMTSSSPSASKVSGTSKVSGITNATGLQSNTVETLEAKVETLQNTVNNLTSQIAQLMTMLQETHPPDPKRRSLNETPQKVRESKQQQLEKDLSSDDDSMHTEGTTQELEIMFSPTNRQLWQNDSDN